MPKFGKESGVITALTITRSNPSEIVVDEQRLRRRADPKHHQNQSGRRTRRLRAMIDHLDCGPRAVQTLLKFRSARTPMVRKSCEAHSENSFLCVSATWTCFSHRRGDRSRAGLSCARAVRGWCPTPSWHKATRWPAFGKMVCR